MTKKTTSYFDEINWQEPWLQHIPSFLREPRAYKTSIGNPKSLAEVFNKLLDNQSAYYKQQLLTGYGKPLSFVSQSALDNMNEHTPTAYETFIANSGKIPTRDNLHDLFNAWIWFTFPKTKALLNSHQASQIANDGISSSRGRVRDAITVLDENGAILITSDTDVACALKNFDWKNCLVKPRSHWCDPMVLRELQANYSKHAIDEDKLAKPDIANHEIDGSKRVIVNKQAGLETSMLMICGHALIEQLVKPRKSLCSHTFILTVPAEFFTLSMADRVEYVDNMLANQVDVWLQKADVNPRQLSPLPVLGVPYYWQENADSKFYNDDYVFRSGRRKK